MKKLLFVLSIFSMFVASASAQKGGHSLNISVVEKGTNEPVVMATVQLQPAGSLTVTDMDGRAVIKNVPDGDYTLQITYVGFEQIKTRIKVSKDLQLKYSMVPTSLSLKEVQVVARQKESGASTASVVGRQAIDHLQATSLADIMQLLPGHIMGNHDLTQQATLQLRTLVNNIGLRLKHSR